MDNNKATARMIKVTREVSERREDYYDPSTGEWHTTRRDTHLSEQVVYAPLNEPTPGEELHHPSVEEPPTAEELAKELGVDW
ncbi:hypothetical protein [Streptomyces catenulae]|uniref:Uncharacterized protein n=1 Tax=Streptomyces catenulae TaxID=66875 RepID=A0ABV2YTB2_9ACTN|nr:hypothetical protein [Streptomyces catenulae]